ncbi:hypothetical protein GTY65_35115 [Streptomyces sp. SID8379]|uniref:DUF6227 family protein n=1 Tax=unclassified Streptomyces TaxID=2593676 RepID=UPI000365C6EE|nr:MULTISPECIES: DUF6227 family protein [unclassified Streptomyces]MYW69262.1 hypothetical protein [Streptomyces sp. SID8379]
MSVPYDYESGPTYDAPSHTSPEEQLALLLGRSINSFELPDETLEGIDCALAYDSSLHSAHHSAGLHRETYRHTWLLADGSALTLWELVHNTGRDGVTQHEVYVTADEVHLATGRLPLAPEAAPGFDLEVSLAPEGRENVVGPGVRVQFPPVPPRRRTFGPADPDSSVDHARRLLRRAENPEVETRPGPGTARLLREACAHQITQAFGRRISPGFALYEHAFLLGDGCEISLWEVEHTATPDGRHMCEVYPTQEAARAAIERRAATRVRR